MYNRKFINDLKNKYKKGGIKKYQEAGFPTNMGDRTISSEMEAYDYMDELYNQNITWVDFENPDGKSGGRTYYDSTPGVKVKKWTIETGPITGSWEDMPEFKEEDREYLPSLEINHDKWNNYTNLTRDIQLRYLSDIGGIPDYLQTLSEVDIQILLKDLKDNDVMGGALFDQTSGQWQGTNPEYTQAVSNEIIRRMEVNNQEVTALHSEIQQNMEIIQHNIKVRQDNELSTGDKIDMTLSTAGMTPVIGAIPDAINFVSNVLQSGHSLITADWDELGTDLENTGWSALGIIPGIGLATGTGKTGRNIQKINKASSNTKDLITKNIKNKNLTTNRQIVNKRLSEINNKNLPIVRPKGGPPAVIVKNANDLTSGGVNFIRPTVNSYPLIRYSDDMKHIVNNPINKNAGKMPWFKRPFTGWKNSAKELKDALTSPMINWRPGNRFLGPPAAIVRHFSNPRNIIIESLAGAIIYKTIDEFFIEPNEDIIKEIEATRKYNEGKAIEIQREMPIYSAEQFNDTIPTGQNFYNMLLYQGKLPDWKRFMAEEGVMYWDYNLNKVVHKKFDTPNVSDEEALEAWLTIAPLNWGEDTDNNHKKFGASEEGEEKQFGGYRSRQMGGYMGVPQQNMGAQQYVGDEGNYMGRMQEFQMGGQQLPGGNVQPIPGSDAVQFSGATHDQGGIMMDEQTEVEDGETMDKVNMAKGGGPKDYFFSSHLKKGGKSYAEHHKDILAKGGDQGEIDWLAKMQEKAAGRNPNKVSTAKTGGYVKKYQNAGPAPERNIYSNEYALVEEVYKDLGYTGTGLGATEYQAVDEGAIGYKNIQGKNLQDVNGTMTHTGYYGDIGPAERQGFFNRNREIMADMGIEKWEDFDPAVHTKTFQEKYNEFLKAEFTNSQDFRNALFDKGIKTEQDYLDAVGFTNNGHKSQEIDNFFGSFTHGRTSSRRPGPNTQPTECECEDASNPGVMIKYPCADPDCGCPKPPACEEKTITVGEKCACDENMSKEDPCCCVEEGDANWDDCNTDDSTTTQLWNPGPLQLLPAAYAFSEGPDYMSQHPMQSPEAIIPERLAKTHLERVDMNADRARNASDARSLNKFIETSGGGSSNIVNKMAAYAKKRQADSDITDTENKTNIAISNQEAVMDQDRKGKNVDNALDASKFNVTSQLEANKHNSTMEATVDEFNRASDSAVKDRRLMALDNATKTMTGLYTDKLQYEAQERMARAVSGQTGIYQREQSEAAYSQQLMSQGIMPGTDGRYEAAMEKHRATREKLSFKYGGYKRRF